MCTWPRQRLMSAGTVKSMPRLLWKSGITSLNNLTAKERLGVLFTITVLSLIDHGRDVLLNGISLDDLNKMSGVFQGLLCYRMWLTKTQYWSLDDRDAKIRARRRILKLMSQLQRDWNRATGNGFFIPKFHEQRHVPDDINRHGPPCGSHTGVTEHQHIHTKKATQHTQLIGNKLDHQTSLQVHKSNVINSSMEVMNNVHVNNKKVSSSESDKNCIYVPQNRAIGTLSFIMLSFLYSKNKIDTIFRIIINETSSNDAVPHQ